MALRWLWVAAAQDKVDALKPQLARYPNPETSHPNPVRWHVPTLDLLSTTNKLKQTESNKIKTLENLVEEVSAANSTPQLDLFKQKRTRLVSAQTEIKTQTKNCGIKQRQTDTRSNQIKRTPTSGGGGIGGELDSKAGSRRRRGSHRRPRGKHRPRSPVPGSTNVFLTLVPRIGHF